MKDLFLAAVGLADTLVMAALPGRDELTLFRRVGATVGQFLAWRLASRPGHPRRRRPLRRGATARVLAVAKASTGSWTPTYPLGLCGHPQPASSSLSPHSPRSRHREDAHAKREA